MSTILADIWNAIVSFATRHDPHTPIDANAVLSARSAQHPELDWQNSIVDLLKLVGLDSSYASRATLARELGRSDYAGTAPDNVWLHQQVMAKITSGEIK